MVAVGGSKSALMPKARSYVAPAEPATPLTCASSAAHDCEQTVPPGAALCWTLPQAEISVSERLGRRYPYCEGTILHGSFPKDSPQYS